MESGFDRYVYGYRIQIRESAKGQNITYRASIPELKIDEPSQDKGRAIIKVFDKLKEKLKTQPIEINNDSNYFEEIQVRMFKVNQKLTNFGFAIIADEMNNKTVAKLEEICKDIDLNIKYTLTQKKTIENSIANVFIDYVMNPSIRALNMASLIINTPHINKFSHLIEQAYISLFRGEYISTVMTLFPVIEGTLISLCKFNIDESKPKENSLLNNWAKLEYDKSKPQMTHQCITDEYIRAFIDIWKETFFSKHSLSEENLYFNRNYIAHLMGEGEFYSRNNAFKLIILVDLLAHVLASCFGTHNKFTYDLNNESYRLRRECYIMQAMQIDGIRYKLFEEHNYFKGYK